MPDSASERVPGKLASKGSRYSIFEYNLPWYMLRRQWPTTILHLRFSTSSFYLSLPSGAPCREPPNPYVDRGATVRSTGLRTYW
jgi:hypothetical protein